MGPDSVEEQFGNEKGILVKRVPTIRWSASFGSSAVGPDPPAGNCRTDFFLQFCDYKTEI